MKAGNLGLAINCAAGICVRVIRMRPDKLYVYDGLYRVAEWKRCKGSEELGAVVYKFKLERLQSESGTASQSVGFRPMCSNVRKGAGRGENRTHG